MLRTGIRLEEHKPVERNRRAVQTLDISAGLADIADENRSEPRGGTGILPHEAARAAHVAALGNPLFDRRPRILSHSEA